MDISYLLWLQGIREALPPLVEQFFVAVSALAITNALILLPCILYWCLDKRAGQYLVFTFSWGSFLNQFVKNTVCCYRPWIRSAAVHPAADALAEATGYSFPSGHTQAAASLFGGLGSYYRRRLRPLLGRLLFLLCWAFVLLVGFSRNFLGVHTPQDVVVGLAEGIMLVKLVPHVLDWVDEGERRDVLVAVGSVLTCAAYLAYVMLKPYPLSYDETGALLVDPLVMQQDCFKSAGVFLGAMVGWAAERHLVRFETNPHAGIVRNLFRLVLGIAVVGVLHVAARPLLSLGLDPRWYEFVKNLLTILGAAFAGPAAFSAAECRIWKDAGGKGSDDALDAPRHLG